MSEESCENASLWDRVKAVLVASRDNQKSLQDVYANYNMPIEIRQNFPNYIEEVFLPSADEVAGEILPCHAASVDSETVQRLLDFMIVSLTEKVNATAQSE